MKSDRCIGLLVEERNWIPFLESIFSTHFGVLDSCVEVNFVGLRWLIIIDTGAPNAAIAVEKFSEFDALIVARCGTCGSLDPNVEVGSIFVATGAIRDEGTSCHYAPLGFPAIPSRLLLESAGKTAKCADIRIQSGVVWTTDGRYVEDDEKLTKYMAVGANAVDMETSAFYVTASVRRIHAISLSIITDSPYLEIGKLKKGTVSLNHLDAAIMVRKMIQLVVDIVDDALLKLLQSNTIE